MKGILLAGGNGTRLRPSSIAISKHLLPVYNKPMIYYSLSTLMLAGIREILLIGTAKDIPLYRQLLGDGAWLGCSISYKEQDEPKGIADAFIIGKEFIGEDRVALILGDNIFFGQGFKEVLAKARNNDDAVFFGYPVKDAERYGVASISENGKLMKIEEKPKIPKSNLAITGLYFYPNDVVDYVHTIAASSRGELEITDLNNLYITESRANLITFGRGFNWIDAGTEQSLLAASEMISSIETRNAYKIGSIEEIALSNGWTTAESILQMRDYHSSDYDMYVKELLSV